MYETNQRVGHFARERGGGGRRGRGVELGFCCCFFTLRNTERETYRDRETDRQTDRGRQTQRERQRERDRDRQREKGRERVGGRTSMRDYVCMFVR